MNRVLGFAMMTAVVMAFGCSDSTDAPTPTGSAGSGGTKGDAASACGGATASILAGSCTYTVAGLTTCAEDYYNHALTSTELDVFKQACSGSGYTFSETAPCPTTDVACKCVDTSGLFKRVRYGYGAYVDACGTCTGDCYSKQ